MINHLTKNGISYYIRQADENDAEQIIQYSKNIFASTNQLLTTPEEYNISVADEKVWINNIRKSKNSELLIAILDNQVIGCLFFIGQQKAKNAHVGELGINVHPGYQATGIGRALMETLIRWVNKHNAIEKIVLEVFATNLNAIKLYYSLGFKEEGRFVKAVKQKNGEYVDVIQMYLFAAKD
ncbi:GNAT family N-acetyltransferase [Mucilaginibacter lappiensis]|uniref:RimJ/RimL family protein N-acetyltransferase n=1 Tax=Mucilaginibacter lappiensis TaxID=354630 RepID=A0A841JJ92_9SPHI|nr:GNAT family N-acetyltransferase [Mucilaginibacter lappiensis]MBB6131020.1 RimJ/RimL family protein N-acetyltransferase [Mucilaginibacter lappiensis]